MSRRPVPVGLGFLAALALGAAIAALLTAAGVDAPWPILTGWLVFLAAGTIVGRRPHE